MAKGFIGSLAINGIHRGSEKIKSVYKGSERLYVGREELENLVVNMQSPGSPSSTGSRTISLTTQDSWNLGDWDKITISGTAKGGIYYWQGSGTQSNSFTPFIILGDNTEIEVQPAINKNTPAPAFNFSGSVDLTGYTKEQKKAVKLRGKFKMSCSTVTGSVYSNFTVSTTSVVAE